MMSLLLLAVVLVEGMSMANTNSEPSPITRTGTKRMKSVRSMRVLVYRERKNAGNERVLYLTGNGRMHCDLSGDGRVLCSLGMGECFALK